MEMKITPEAKTFLATTAKWAKFLAIVGFVVAAIYALTGLITLIAGSAMSLPGMAAGGRMLGLMMLIISAIYFVPMYYLYSFATRTAIAVQTDNEQELTEALNFQAKYFKFLGIFLIVMLCIVALTILFSIIGVMAMAH